MFFVIQVGELFSSTWNRPTGFPWLSIKAFSCFLTVYNMSLELEPCHWNQTWIPAIIPKPSQDMDDLGH